MSSNETITAAQLARALTSIQYHGYVDVAGVALVIWDYLLTLPEEIRLIWLESKTGVTILFTINRYLIFFELFVSAYGYISTNVSNDFCKYGVAYWLVATSMFHLIVSDNIVWLCVSALYGHAKRVRIPLLLWQITTIVGAALTLVFVHNDSEGNREPELPPDFHRCTRSIQLEGLWAFWLPILAYELTTLSLVGYKLWSYRKNRLNFRSDLLELVLRNTMLYLALICVMFALNSWMYSNADQTLTTVLNSITLGICSILGNRMLLNLRAESKRRTGEDSYAMSTRPAITVNGTMHFADHRNTTTLTTDTDTTATRMSYM